MPADTALPADEGPSSAEAADVFTTLLIDIKAAVCQGNSSCGFVISADSEPPQWNDYHRLNASKMDGKNVDFVNYMQASRDPVLLSSLSAIARAVLCSSVVIVVRCLTSARCCCCRCYFDATPDSDVSRWNESISMLLDQGYPPSTINIAIPYCAPPSHRTQPAEQC